MAETVALQDMELLVEEEGVLSVAVVATQLLKGEAIKDMELQVEEEGVLPVEITSTWLPKKEASRVWNCCCCHWSSGF